MKLLLENIFKDQIPENNHELFPHTACKEKTIVIIDDDPTGCQTAYDAPVLFVWDMETLFLLFQSMCPLFFILTNTRSMTEETAVMTIKNVVEELTKAAKKAEREFIIISRSDSTLRGHYPAEPIAIDQSLGIDSMHCLIPAFFQGGRYTYNDVHYVKEGAYLIPAGETPFAKDKSFGFKSSDLKDYVFEKTLGEVGVEQVLSLSISDLREKGPDYIKEKLLDSDSKVCIVNALAQSDLDVFSAGAWEAIFEGKNLLFRSAASFINSFACMPVKETLTERELKRESVGGGLIIVGSYVPKSSSQLQFLLEHGNAYPLELNVESLFSETRESTITSIASRAGQLINSGNHTVIYTSRELKSTDSPEKNLEIGKNVSDALVDIVRKIKDSPSFIISKGGITSHEIALNGLNMKKATVIGQALPGVPVLVPEDRTDMKYMIFPGNVGGEEDLLKLFNMMK
ncbi:four-carbon acid sugar kinase family protein [Bacteroidota bacterium]